VNPACLTRRSRHRPRAGAAGRASNAYSLIIALFLAIASLSACKVKLISDYDEVIDHSATELQKKIEGFVHQMESAAGTPNGTYDANKQFYDGVRTDISALRVRAEAAGSNNDLTVQEIGLIEQNVEKLRELHVAGAERGLRAAVAEPALSAINVQFVALIRLELAKKRGQ
jgi:hypothetical protein